MRRLPAGSILLVCLMLAAGHAGADPTREARAHQTVSTNDPAAQAAFDDGLTLLYAYDPEAARRAFEHAASLDPSLAMAQWGVAMSYGPNINTAYVPANQRAGRAAIAKALAEANGATPLERALVNAAQKRFAFDGANDATRSAEAYAAAMRAAADAFPDDDDVQALAVESAMDVHPWDYWTSAGKPEAWTPALVARLDTVLARTPGHIGAAHFLIHLVEASPHPEDALAAADALAAMSFAPAAEHLTHMPAHTYMRVGKYDEAAAANAHAVDQLHAYLAGDHAGGHGGYINHDCQFGVDAYMMAGEHAAAKRLATACDSTVELENVAVRFRRFADVANASGDLALGCAAVAAGKFDEAAAHVRALAKTSGEIARIGTQVLTARLAAARGERDAEIAADERAVAIEDGLGYSEPPYFWYPVRESLGGAYLRAGRAADAERTFRADLTRNPDNPRSEFGLARALEREGRTEDAASAQRDFERAWRHADVGLSVDDL